MKLPKKKARIVLEAVNQFQNEGVIDGTTGQRLRENLQFLPFDWRRLARYAFIGAIICILIAVGSALADQWLMELLGRLFKLSYALKCLGLAALSAAIIFLGILRRQKHPEKVYSNEAIFLCGVLGIAGAIACLGKAVDTGSGHYSLLILLAALVYGFLGFALESKLIWFFSLLSLGGWFGAETGYESGWGAYYLGMAYPMRFVLFGAALTLLSLLLQKRQPKIARFFGITRVMGLLYLFIALWILSIWGNFQGYDDWRQASHWELFHWSIYFGVVAVACIYLGLKNDDGTLRGFGLTFLGINLYTRFFEYFWDGLHKAVFFALLGLSLWLIGSRAERIWQLQFLRGIRGQND